MNITKLNAVVILGMFLLLCVSPLSVHAADCSERTNKSVIIEDNSAFVFEECETIESIKDSTNQYLLRSSSHPVCDHRDPTNPYNSLSSMRYLRTVNYYNYVEMRYDIRDWYQCIVCGYETFFVHGHYN